MGCEKDNSKYFKSSQEGTSPHPSARPTALMSGLCPFCLCFRGTVSQAGNRVFWSREGVKNSHTKDAVKDGNSQNAFLFTEKKNQNQKQKQKHQKNKRV